MNKGKIALVEAEGLIQMYQAGFLDGFRHHLVNKLDKNTTLNVACKRAFENRFAKKIQRKIK